MTGWNTGNSKWIVDRFVVYTTPNKENSRNFKFLCGWIRSVLKACTKTAGKHGEQLQPALPFGRWP